MYNKPLIVHANSKKLYVLDWLDPERELTTKLLPFADVIQTPERVSTFRISPYTLWTAAAKGLVADDILNVLDEYSYTKIPVSFRNEIRRYIQAYGTLEFHEEHGDLLLVAKHDSIIKKIQGIESIKSKAIRNPSSHSMLFPMRHRIEIKKILFSHDLFVKDFTFHPGEPLGVHLVSRTISGEPFLIRDYQKDAAKAFQQYESKAGGGGTILMPPGAGKTIVALKIMEYLQTTTLILVENQESAYRWKQELLDKTDLTEHYIGVYEMKSEKLPPVTIGTYANIAKNIDAFHGYGFIIYDDAYKLPAETYERTIEIRTRYRLAMASTLARADEQGNKVFALVGPKWYEILHQELIKKGFNVPITCIEVRVPLSAEMKQQYNRYSENSNKRRELAAFNVQKDDIVKQLLMKYIQKQMVITSYRTELIERYKKLFGIESIHGMSDESQNEALIKQFNNKQISWCNISSLKAEKVLLKGVDVIVATSYQQGSEREEYLRIGKILPKEEGKEEGLLYSLVSEGTIEEKDYRKRRICLLHYGFPYIIHKAEWIGNREEK
ncbi:helicase-associated domain-containing protein [Bacillus sp. FJAT-51639]|uniref:DNA 3'-5' helicase n=1 Tax=Bacillus bruguierae TaxID=3127667 RepID=A0ABU8FJT2_9BACI